MILAVSDKDSGSFFRSVISVICASCRVPERISLSFLKTESVLFRV